MKNQGSGAWAKKVLARGRLPSAADKKARADSSVWECRRAVRNVHPSPLYDRLAAGCRLPR
jgi:hypothetical protein